MEVGSKVRRLIEAIIPILEKEFLSEIELMISNCRGINFDWVVVVIHDLTRTHERGGFNSSLELVARIQVQEITLILTSDSFDHWSHDLKSSCSIGLIFIRSKKSGWEGRTMNIISPHYRDSHEVIFLNSNNKEYDT